MTDRPTEDEIVELGARGITERCYGQVWNFLHDTRREVPRRETRAVLAALRSAGMVVEQGWQPIETAPKDGQRILLLMEFPEKWADAGSSVIKIARWDKFGKFFNIEGRYHGGRRATHWRPLPSPPATGGEDNG